MRKSPDSGFNPGEDKEQPKREIPIHNLDLRKGWDSESKKEILIEYLTSLGINVEHFLYTGLEQRNIPTLQKKGYYSESGIVYCANYSELLNDSGTAFDSAEEAARPAMALYNPEFMEKKDINYTYQVKPGVTPEQLIKLILKLKF